MLSDVAATVPLMELQEGPTHPPDTTMSLRYGFNETLGWRHFALGADRERIWTRLRETHTALIRIFAFSPFTPAPDSAWEQFAAYVEAVLRAGAVPMITFAALPENFGDAGSVGHFAARCGSVAARCVDSWGGEAVRRWAWSIGNKPNSAWANGALTFDDYRRIYEETAGQILCRLEKYLQGRRPLLGGPGVDGFQPFWMDWIWRFVTEIDDSLMGFVAWNRYGDWRPAGEWGAPANARVFRRLLMSRTAEYERRAQSIGRILEGRDMLNICTELHAHAHHDPLVSGPFNQTTFGAAYYGSALIHLMRGGADAEMLWAGTDETGTYGAIDSTGQAKPLCHAKQLCSSYVRYGDRLEFPASEGLRGKLDIVLAHDGDELRGAFLVHVTDANATYDLSDVCALRGCSRLLKLDGDGTGIEEIPYDGFIRFSGYGVAAITSRPAVGELG